MAEKSNVPSPDDPKVAAVDAAAADALAAGTADAADGVGASAPAAELQKLQAELAQYKDRWLRSQAELENYRKRSQRELADERRFAELRLLGDLLPVVDNIGRAIAAASSASDAPALLEGFRMVGQQLEAILKQHQCQRLDALGEPFDPNLHEALLQVPSPEQPAGVVVQVARDGYKLHDRVVRPAQVIVSSGPQADAAS